MVTHIHGGGALQRPEIGNVLDDDQRAGVTTRVGADHAGIAGVDIAAGRADTHLVDRLAHGGGERLKQLLLLLDEMEGRAPCRTRPEPRHLGQELDQAFDLWTGDSFRHRSDLEQFQEKCEADFRPELRQKEKVDVRETVN